MFKRNKLLFCLVLILLPLWVFWGCDQPEDVLTPISRTNIWLSPSKLPTNPEGTVYELWVANATDTVPLAKFGYDFSLGRFLEADGSVRADTNRFYLGYDLFEFTNILVSVEPVPDNNTNSPASILLMDVTTDETIKLKFPMIDSLWQSTMWYSMETPSDGLDSITDGCALWFCTYTEHAEAFNDTLGIDSIWVDTFWEEEGEGPEPGDTVIVKIGIDPASIITKDTVITLGLDTYTQRVVRKTELLDTLVDAPYFTTFLGVEYEVVEGEVSWDDFNQGDENEEFALPSLLEYGWKFKGWVVSPYIEPDAVNARITLPAWPVIGNEFDETDGAMLTTGAFADCRFADDANPYVASPRVPAFPGEDFLENLPGGISRVNLVPNQNGNSGRVFVSLEPIYCSRDTTNFPLILFLDELPNSRDDVTDGEVTQQFFLRGWMQDEADPYRGFPWMLVTYERF